MVAALGCDRIEVAPDAGVALTVVDADADAEDAAMLAVSATAAPAAVSVDASASVPDWAAGAIFYQIFPERFRNGDPANDPTRESLEFPENVGDSWAVTPWTGDWYERAGWERDRGANFYENGVFDRRYGGDLQGILDKLDYLEELGVNALYLNPVFYGRSLHKYDGNTYHHIDPHFGPDPQGDLALMATETADPATWKWTAADRLFLELLDEAHNRGLRVVIDGVFNHTGRDFFAFADLRERQQESPYRDWYIVHSFDDPETPFYEFKYKGWWGVDTLPEFADNEAGDDLHPAPKAYIFDATRRWMDPNGDGDPADGVDGWRLDVAAEVPIKFWKEWNAHCRRLNPDGYTVAEHWHDAAGFLAGGGFSATMNYHGFAFPVKGFLIDGTLSAEDAAAVLTERMNEFPAERRYALQNLIDSHDTDRVASMVVNVPNGRPYVQPHRSDYDVSERASPRHWDDYQVRKPNAAERRIQRMVAVMQATFVGPPMIYYGTESGMWGADDPCDRMPMVWDDLDFAPQTRDPLGRERPADEVAFDHDLHAFFRGLFKLRSECSELQRGGFEVVHTGDDSRTLAFRRSDGERSCFVIFNRGDESAEVELPAPRVQEVFTASGETTSVGLVQKGETVVVRLPGLEAVVVRELGPAE